MQDTIKEIIANNLGKVLINEKIANLTTYKVGGKARAVVYPKTLDNLVSLIKLLKNRSIKHIVLGNGSNVLFSDKIYDGIIIKLDYFNDMVFDGVNVRVGAGVSLIKLSREALRKGLAGLEFADGIPGTVGGAVFMNAGAYGEDMSLIVRSVKILKDDGEIIELNKDEMEFSYRTSYLQKHLSYVCIEAKLKLRPCDKEELEQMVLERREKRKLSQPLNYPSAGSVFRNPKDMYAGKMIEEMGLQR